MKGLIHMKYNSKKFYLFLSVLRVLILIILLNHMKIVFSKMAYLYLFIEYIVKMEYIIKNENAIDPKKEIGLMIFFVIILVPLFIKVNYIFNIICYIMSVLIAFVL
jgi:hypothetical protein